RPRGRRGLSPSRPSGGAGLCIMKVIGRRLLPLARRRLAAAGFALALLALTLAGRYFYVHWQFVRHLEDARRAEERFDFESARKHLAECLRIRPRDAETHLCLARDARRAGD